MIPAVLLLAQQTWSKPELLCQIKNERVTESSGVAASPLKPGVFYTHNDSGDSARFFRFNSSGEVTGIFKLKDVKASDFEDMSAATVGGNAYVYLGDIGDNDRKRSSIAIYRVDDPAEKASSTLIPNLSLTLTYPDKPRDCEALLVEPGSGSIFLVTKARDGETGVYYLPSPQKSGSYELKKLGVIPLDTGALGGKYVTAGDISPDRKSVVLRTYSGALVFEPGTVFRDWWREVPKTVSMPVMSQSEAICFTNDGRGLLVTSEGNPCPVFLVKAR